MINLEEEKDNEEMVSENWPKRPTIKRCIATGFHRAPSSDLMFYINIQACAAIFPVDFHTTGTFIFLHKIARTAVYGVECGSASFCFVLQGFSCPR